MARRVWLHVGTPKSATTFLQSVWWANRAALREQGLLLPGDGVHEHFWASCEVREHAALTASLPPRAAGAWDRVVEATRRAEGDVLISHELFSRASAARSAQALERLAGVAEEVHVVLTARDLARQVPAEWQQRTKHGRSQRFGDFVHEVRHDPTSPFWEVQDLPSVLDRWSVGLPAERVHLVVLAQPGGPRGGLWDAVCDLIGVDGAGMTERAVSANESLGLVEAETMRRVSGRLNAGGLDKPTERLLKGFFAETVLRSVEAEKIVLPAEAWDWALERSRAAVAALGTREVHVVGDLEDLVPGPTPVPGRSPDEVGEDEVARVAVGALARFVEHERDRRSRPVGGRAGTGPVGHDLSAAGAGRRLAGRAARLGARAVARVAARVGTRHRAG